MHHIQAAIYGIHRATESYEEQKSILARNERLKSITSRQNNTSHTSQVSERLENEARASAPTLEELVKKTVEEANKQRDSEIAELRKALELEKKKKSPSKQPKAAGSDKKKSPKKSNAKNDKGAGGGASNKSTAQSTNRSTPNSQEAEAEIEADPTTIRSQMP